MSVLTVAETLDWLIRQIDWFGEGEYRDGIILNRLKRASNRMENGRVGVVPALERWICNSLWPLWFWRDLTNDLTILWRFSLFSVRWRSSSTGAKATRYGSPFYNLGYLAVMPSCGVVEQLCRLGLCLCSLWSMDVHLVRLRLLEIVGNRNMLFN